MYVFYVCYVQCVSSFSIVDKENCQEGNQGVHLTRNLSERFESRFSTVKIVDSPAMMLKGMENSTLGIWVAHGEGEICLYFFVICQELTELNFQKQYVLTFVIYYRPGCVQE